MRTMAKAEFPGDLGSSVAKGASWVAFLRISGRILRILRLAVLARLLSPQDFGTFAVALLTVDLLTTFFHSGFIQALIHKKTETERYLDTAWTVGLIRRSLLALLLFILAPHAAQFFGAPDAAPVIRILSISFLFRAVANIAVVFFEKDLAFHKYFIYEFIGTATDFLVSIGGAFILRSYWALAWGFLAGVAAQSLASYVMSPFRPSLRLDLSKARELFRYGKWVVLSVILVYFGSNLGQIFVGKLLGTAVLGIFLMASKTADLATGEISLIVSRVAFPALSKIQDDPARLQSAWLKVLRMVWAVVLPPVTGILCLTTEITAVFLGRQWLEAVPAIRLLTAAGMIMAAAQTASPLFRGTGHPRNDAFMHSARVSVLLLALYPLSRTAGISGAAAGAVLGSAGAAAVGFALSKRILRIPGRRYFDAFWPQAVSATAMACALFLMKALVVIDLDRTIAAGLKIAGLAAAGTIVYGFTLILISRIRPEATFAGEFGFLLRFLRIKNPDRGKGMPS